MKLELTDDEQKLLIMTIEESTFAGRLARIVADLLDKLKETEGLKE